MDNHQFEFEQDPDSDRLIEPDRLKKLIEDADDLTMLPAVAMEAIEMANDPECSIHDFVHVIEKDTGLVTEILSLSNSAVYQTACEIKGIQHAVVVVGFSQCKNLIISSSVKSLAKKLPPSVEWARNVLWRHGIQTATIARSINQLLKLGFDGEEFSGAMIHDIGRLLIAAAAPDVFEVVDRLSFFEGDRLLAAERDLTGTDHCEIGAWFAGSGQLPKALVDVIRFHHTPSEAPSNGPLVALVSAADHMANHLMHMGSGECYVPGGNPGLGLLLGAATGKAGFDVGRLTETSFEAAEKVVEGMAPVGTSL